MRTAAVADVSTYEVPTVPISRAECDRAKPGTLAHPRPEDASITSPEQTVAPPPTCYDARVRGRTGPHPMSCSAKKATVRDPTCALPRLVRTTAGIVGEIARAGEPSRPPRSPRPGLLPNPEPRAPRGTRGPIAPAQPHTGMGTTLHPRTLAARHSTPQSMHIAQ
ncbi:hypothetical protein FKP32DRAFT_1593510 [Trametes sanguinea]|nr:hypothetical protein FKP32DRAFT_1593510 [Trametes sanguinea]